MEASQGAQEELRQVEEEEQSSSEEEDEAGEGKGQSGGSAAGGEAEAHLRKARAHMRSGKYELAVRELGAGLKACTCREAEFEMLLLRSEAYCGISKQLREIPAAQSERRAIYAPDPCHLACLGLKDADSALKIQGDSAEAVLCKVPALLLLERYGEAEAAAVRGLELSPGHEALAALLAEVQQALADAPCGSPPETAEQFCRKRQRVLERNDDSDCILCMKLLYEPVTTPCGHTFCRPCFARSMDHSNRCPMCRTVLHVGRELPVTVTLKALLEKSFPEEYSARREEETGGGGGAGQEAPIPLFVMSPMLPGEKMALNIFEPRYRLMVRRCMEGSHRFGMATVDASHQLHQVACECEITECQPLPDGRFYLEIVGRRRFQPLDTAEQDGYRIARPQYIEDAPVAAGSQEAEALAALATEVEGLADGWVGRLKSMAQTRRGVAELLHRAGDKPPSTDFERLSFWVANLACPLIDDASHKLLFLTTTSTKERLERGREILSQLRDTSAPGCCVM